MISDRKNQIKVTYCCSKFVIKNPLIAIDEDEKNITEIVFNFKKIFDKKLSLGFHKNYYHLYYYNIEGHRIVITNEKKHEYFILQSHVSNRNSLNSFVKEILNDHHKQSV